MDHEKKIEILHANSFFAHFAKNDIEIIAQSTNYITFNKDDIIFKEGDVADNFYIIISGTVHIIKKIDNDQIEVLATKTSGDIFGEMSIIDALPRSASVIALTSVELFTISNQAIHTIMNKIPTISLEISKALCMNVRSSNLNYINELEEQNEKLQIAYEQLKEAQDKLLKAERLSVIGKFTSFIIHDIKNPLANIRAYAELITMNEKASDPFKKSAGIIIQEADRLAHMTKDLLDYSKGTIVLEQIKINLSMLISSVLPLIKKEFENYDMSVEHSFNDMNPILIDPERIKRVLDNITKNGLGAMTKGGVFSIKTFEDENNVILELKDTGKGMTKEVLENIYEPFFSQGKKSGTGLGMAITKSILDAHNASIEIESEIDKGTRFRIFFPKE